MKLTDIDVSAVDTLFLDRDGVINKLRPGDYVKNWDEFEFLPDVFNALALWNETITNIIIVTNQRGIGRGLMTEQDLEDIHRRMSAEIGSNGGRIDKIYYCAAVDENDFNRKPNIGMALQAKQDFPDIDFDKSLMIGDSESDMKFAKNAGMNGILV